MDKDDLKYYKKNAFFCLPGNSDFHFYKTKKEALGHWPAKEIVEVIPAERVKDLTNRIEKLEKALEKAKEQRNSMAFRALKTVDFNTSWLEMNKEIDEMLR